MEADECQNASIEIHDSIVGAIVAVGADVLVRLAPAYVHRSQGRPGIDPGFGFVQDIEMLILGGKVLERPAELPCELATGTVSVGGVVQKSGVPLPLRVDGKVELDFSTVYGEHLRLDGHGLWVDAVGEADFVEEFPGA